MNLGRTASAIDSTASAVKAAIEAEEDAAALIAVANKTGNNGSGLVAAMAYAALAGGVDPVVTSTAADVLAAINADEDASALVTASVRNSRNNDTGSGLVAALGYVSLAGGVDHVSGVLSPLDGQPRRVIAWLLR